MYSLTARILSSYENMNFLHLVQVIGLTLLGKFSMTVNSHSRHIHSFFCVRSQGERLIITSLTSKPPGWREKKVCRFNLISIGPNNNLGSKSPGGRQKSRSVRESRTPAIYEDANNFCPSSPLISIRRPSPVIAMEASMQASMPPATSAFFIARKYEYGYLH